MLSKTFGFYCLLLFLSVFYGCSHNKREFSEKQNNAPIRHEDIEWPQYNSRKDFYSAVNSGEITTIWKYKSDFLNDTIYLCDLGGLEYYHMNLYVNDGGKILTIYGDGKLDEYLSTMKKYFCWENITENNIKLFYSTIMIGYKSHIYSQTYSSIKRFADQICSHDSLVYSIQSNEIVFVFRFADYFSGHFMKIKCVYDKKTDKISLDTLSINDYHINKLR